MEQLEKESKYYRLIWELIKYRPWYYMLDCFIWIIVFLLPLVPGLITKAFFDILSNHTSFDSGIWGVLIIMVITALTHISFMRLGARVDTVHRFMMSSLIRRNLLWNIFQRPGGVSLPCSTGEAVNSFRDDANQVEESITWTIDMLGTAIFSIVAVLILFQIDSQMTFFVFTPLVIVTVLTQKASEKIKKIRERSREATADVIGATGEIFRSVQAIKIAGAETNFLNYMQKLNNKRHKLMVKDTVLNQLINSINSVTISIGTGLILLMAGQSMKSGNFSIGDFVLFISYLNYVTNFTHEFGSFLAHYKHTGVSFQRMMKLWYKNQTTIVEHNPLPIKSEIKLEQTYDHPEVELKSIRVDGITYKYRNSQRGIEDISFHLNKGDFVVITGRVGSGKSTLLKAILGLLELQSGHVSWNGNRIENPAQFFVPPIIAYTSQVPNLFNDTIRGNILLGLPASNGQLEKAIYRAVLENDISNIDNGLDTVIGPRGSKLSGGQMQRVAAARMFVRDAELLVFDDISSALDLETEQKLWKRLIEESQSTCIVVSNRRAALKRADKIIVLKDGHIEAEGNFEELLTYSDEFREICGA